MHVFIFYMGAFNLVSSILAFLEFYKAGCGPLVYLLWFILLTILNGLVIILLSYLTCN